MGTLSKVKGTPEEPKPHSSGRNFVLGKPQVETRKTQDLVAWDILPGSAGKRFNPKEDKSMCVARPRTEDRRE